MYNWFTHVRIVVKGVVAGTLLVAVVVVLLYYHRNNIRINCVHFNVETQKMDKSNENKKK